MLLTEEQLAAYKEQMKGLALMREACQKLHSVGLRLYEELSNTEGEDKNKRELLEALIMNLCVANAAHAQLANTDECFTHNLRWLAEHDYVTPEQKEQIREEFASPLEKMMEQIDKQVREQLESGELVDDLTGETPDIIPLHPGLDVQIVPESTDKVN